jgi:integrase
MHDDTTSTDDHRAQRATSTPGISKRGGRYTYRYHDPLTGKKRYGSAKTKAAAIKKRTATRAAIDDGSYRTPVKSTFADYAREWITGYTGTGSRGIRPATRDEYERDIQRAIAYFGEVHPLTSLDPQAVRKYAQHLGTGSRIDGRALSTRTRKRVMVPLSLCLAQAAEDGLIRSNPAKGLRLGVSPADATLETLDDEDKALTPGEYAALLKVIEADKRHPAHLAVLVRLIASTGLRIGEALALTYTDLGDEVITVRKSLRDGVRGDTKSTASRRTVPVPRDVVRVLKEHRMASVPSDDKDLVFSRLGKPLSGQNIVTQHLRPMLNAAGITRAGIGFHALRHYYATRLLVQGYPVPVVARLLGHSDNGETVMRTYSHVLASDLPSGDEIARALAAGS